MSPLQQLVDRIGYNAIHKSPQGLNRHDVGGSMCQGLGLASASLPILPYL